MLWRGLMVLVCWVVLSSCASSAGSDSGSDAGDGKAADLAADVTDTTPRVQVGGADDGGNGFVDWSSGSYPATLIHGPQGGQHIWVSAKTKNLFPNKARVSVTMYLESASGDELVKPGTTTVTGTLKPFPAPPELPGEWLIYAGLPAFVSQPCKLAQQKVRVQVEVSDLYGVVASNKAWIRPKWTFMPCVVAIGATADGKGAQPWPFFPDEGAKPALAAVAGGGAELQVGVRTLGLNPAAPVVAVTLMTMPTDNTEGQILPPGRTAVASSQVADPLGVPGWSGLAAVKVPVAEPCKAHNQRLRLVIEVADGEKPLGSGQSIVVPSWGGACP
ncbi:MAG: hypothetical protein HY902_05370 [Deltaproteobacteria bacterium]|nr:hypothetical protein [Deltaproteobacteria bacterium]